MNTTRQAQKTLPGIFLSAISFHDLNKKQMTPMDITLMGNTDETKLMRNVAQSLIIYSQDAGTSIVKRLEDWAASTEPYGKEVWDAIKEQEKTLHNAGINISVPMAPTNVAFTGDKQIESLAAGLVSIINNDREATLIPAALTSESDRATANDLANVEGRDQWAKHDINTAITHFSMNVCAPQNTIAALNKSLAPDAPDLARKNEQEQAQRGPSMTL